jgi:hypothetical protein
MDARRVAWRGQSLLLPIRPRRDGSRMIADQ